MNYEGMIVWVEKQDPKDNYYNGEYIVVKQSPNTLYAVSTKGTGYGAHELRQLPLVGEKPYTVISSKRDDKFVRDFADQMLAFSRETKRNWIDSVYTGAAANAKKIYDVLGVNVNTDPTEKQKKVQAATEQVTEILKRFLRTEKTAGYPYGNATVLTHTTNYVANVIVNEMGIEPKTKQDQLNKVMLSTYLVTNAVTKEQNIALPKADFDFLFAEARAHVEGK